MGLQVFNRKRDLLGFGIQVIITCFCVTDNEPFLYAKFSDLRIKIRKSFQKY